MVLMLYFPGALDELLASEILSSQTFLCELAFNDVLGCDTGMVGSRYPECVLTLHPLIADDDVLKVIVERMAHVEDACYVWRRHYYGKMLCTLFLRSETLTVNPLGINPLLKILWVIGFCKFNCFHKETASVLLLFPDNIIRKSKTRTVRRLGIFP